MDYTNEDVGANYSLWTFLQGMRPNFSNPQNNWDSWDPSEDSSNWTLPDLSIYVEADDSVSEPIRMTIIATAYAVVMGVSLFGNLLVCYVVLRHRRLRSVTHTFLANIAFSDLLVTCLNIPFSVSRVLLDHWPFGSFLCSLVPFVQAASVYVSSLTMAAIALDRYRVILSPLKPRLRPPHGLAIIALIWTLAALAALPYAIYSEVVLVFTYRPLRRCQARFPTPALEFRRYLTLITFATQYVAPLTVSALAYGAVVRKLWSSPAVGATTASQRSRQERAKRKTIQMLLVVICIFALCWLPLNVYHLISDVGSSSGPLRHNSTAFLLCHWLAMSSVCYNPFVYCWLNANFRNAVKTCWGICIRTIRRKQITRALQSSITGNPLTQLQGNNGEPSTLNTMSLTLRQHDSVIRKQMTSSSSKNPTEQDALLI